MLVDRNSRSWLFKRYLKSTRMSDTVTETVDLHSITFPPSVLARISPELSLQRHLSLGIRPSLRAFEEFRDINIDEGTLSRIALNGTDTDKSSNNVLGSNVLKCGQTFVITSITGGIIEEVMPVNEIDFGEKELMEMTETRDYLGSYVSIFPQVEVERGRIGAPTDEEMTISQRLYDNVLHSGLISKSFLDVQCGVRTTNTSGDIKIIYPDESMDAELSQYKLQRKWSYVLYAKITVFSRTGPVFDLCWNSLICALKDTKLPRVFIDERATDLKMTVRTRGRSATVRETYDILFDNEKYIPLKINESQVGFASNYGIVDLDPEAQIECLDASETANENINKPESVLLADLDSEAEETSIHSTISVICDSKGKLNNVTILGGGSKITPEQIRRALVLSKARSASLKTKIEV